MIITIYKDSTEQARFEQVNEFVFHDWWTANEETELDFIESWNDESFAEIDPTGSYTQNVNAVDMAGKVTYYRIKIDRGAS